MSRSLTAVKHAQVPRGKTRIVERFFRKHCLNFKHHLCLNFRQHHRLFDPMNAHSSTPSSLSRTAKESRAVSATSLARLERITRSILVLRGQRVMLDRELAAIYGVTTPMLNEQVKRNAERFPADFTFQLTAEETQLSKRRMPKLKGGRGQTVKYLPHVFTEHGAIQASNILNSPRAVAMGIHVARAFVHLRDLLNPNRELTRNFAQLEKRLDKRLTEHHRAIGARLSAVRGPMYRKIPGSARRPVGLNPDLGEMP